MSISRRTSIREGREPQSRAEGGRPPAALARQNPLENHIFTVLYGLTQDNAIGHKLAIALLVVEDLQMLSFAFRPEAGFDSMPKWMPYIFNPLGIKPHDPKSITALFFVGFGIALATAILTVVVSLSFKGGRMKFVWPLHAVRALTNLLSTILLIPIFEIFIYVLACHDPLTEERYILTDASKCVHTVYLIVPAILGTIYLGFQAPLINLVFFHIDPADDDPACKTTGRIDSLYSVLRLILVVLHEVAYDRPGINIVTIVIVSAIMFCGTARYQPFFGRRLNDVRSGLFMAAFWSGIQSGICLAVGGYTNNIGFIVMLVFLLPGFLMGFLGSCLTRRWISRRVYSRMKARQDQLSAEGGSLVQHFSLGGEKAGKRSSMVGSARSSIPRMNNGQSESEVINKISEIVSKVQVEPIKVFLDPADVEIAVRFLQQNSDEEARLLADAIFNAGLEQYPTSSKLTLMKAYYIAAFRIDETWQILEHLQQAKALGTTFDIRFFIFFEERSMEQDDRKEDLQTSSLNIAGFAEILAMESGARKCHLEALLSQKALWEYLKSDKRAADCVPFLLQRIDLNKRKAENYYRQMLNKYPNSKQSLRRFGRFLLTVANDAEGAKKLLDRAEDIENVEARNRNHKGMDEHYDATGPYPSEQGSRPSPLNVANKRLGMDSIMEASGSFALSEEIVGHGSISPDGASPNFVPDPEYAGSTPANRIVSVETISAEKLLHQQGSPRQSKSAGLEQVYPQFHSRV